MIVCKLFRGDRLDLAGMQHEVSGESLGVIMEAACSRLRAARRVLNVEIERLLDRHPLLAKMIATAAFFPNPDSKGMLAEDYLYDLVVAEYQNLEIAVATAEV